MAGQAAYHVVGAWYFPSLHHGQFSAKQALENNMWICHLKRNLTTNAITQFTDIWERLLVLRLTAWVHDSIKGLDCWRKVVSRICISNSVWRTALTKLCVAICYGEVFNCRQLDDLRNTTQPYLLFISAAASVHLLANYDYSVEVWQMVLNKMGRHLTSPLHNAISLNEWWDVQAVGLNKDPEPGTLVWHSVVDVMGVFNNKQATPESVYLKIIDIAQEWSLARRTSLRWLAYRPREPDWTGEAAR